MAHGRIRDVNQTRGVSRDLGGFRDHGPDELTTEPDSR
jgi:hypothetical protein